MKVGTGITSMKLTLVCFILAGVTTTQLAAIDEEINIMDAVQKLIVLDEKLAQVGKAMGKNFEVAETITKFLGALGPAFDAVSALFSFASMFLAKPESEEFQVIKHLKKQMDVRFDRIQEIDRIQELNDKDVAVRQILKSFRDKFASLRVLVVLGMKFLTFPTEQGKNYFIEECKGRNALYMVTWIEMGFKPSLLSETMLYGPHIFKFLKYESAKWEAWVDYILDAAVYASLLHIQCLTARYNISSTELEQEKDKITKKVSAIAEKFKEATRDFHNGFKPFAKKAVENSLSRFKAN